MRTYKYLLLQYIAITLLTSCLFSTLQAQHFRSNVFHEIIPNNLHPDSVLTHLGESYLKAKSEKDTSTMIKCLISQSSTNRINLNFAEAFENSGEAVFLSEEFQDPFLLAKSHEEYGVLYFNFKQDQISGEHFSKSLENYKIAHANNTVKYEDLFQPYYYMYLHYLRLQDDSKGTESLDSCSAILEATKLNPINSIYVNFGRAEILYRQNKLMAAKQKLESGIELLIDTENNKELSAHQNFRIALYNSLSRIYLTQNDKAKAKYCLKEALQEKYLSNELIFFHSFVKSNYAKLLYELGEYKTAYMYNEEARLISDNYLNPRKISVQGFLSVKNSYLDELEKKDKELANKSFLLAKQKQEILRTRILLFIILFAIIVVGLIIRSRILLSKHKKKQQLSKELLEHKNRELTSNMLQLIEKEEIIKTLSQQLELNDKSNSTKSMLKAIQKQSGNLWESFNTRFVEQNGDFYERLQKTVPNLTPAELKLCALVKLNFSGKEMAHLLGMTMNSLHVARHRLRKKMNLERDTNLTGFIGSI